MTSNPAPLHRMERPVLQLALDTGSLSDLLSLAQRVIDSVDWLEAGTPLILAEGMAAVTTLAKTFPQKMVVADMKIMDGGYYEASLGFQAGASIVTVLAVANDATLAAAVKAARACGGRIMADLMQMSDLTARAIRLSELGVDYLCVHTAFDVQETGASPLAEFASLSGLPVAPLIAAGGIGPHNVARLLPFRPAGIVVGGAITRAADPVQAARAVFQQLDLDA